MRTHSLRASSACRRIRPPRIRTHPRGQSTRASGTTQTNIAVQACPRAPISDSDLDLKCVVPDSACVLPHIPPVRPGPSRILPHSPLLPLDRCTPPAQIPTMKMDAAAEASARTDLACSTIDQVTAVSAQSMATAPTLPARGKNEMMSEARVAELMKRAARGGPGQEAGEG
jgi:hypothetical protein